MAQYIRIVCNLINTARAVAIVVQLPPAVIGILVPQTYLLWLLLADVGPPQHGGFDGRQDLQLCADGGDSLAHLLEQNKEFFLRFLHWLLSSTFVLTCSRLVRIRLSVHCLATSLASLVTSSEALAISLAHWISARLFPLPPRTSRDISAISRAIRLAAAMMSLPCGWEGGSKRAMSKILKKITFWDKKMKMETHEVVFPMGSYYINLKYTAWN